MMTDIKCLHIDLKTNDMANPVPYEDAVKNCINNIVTEDVDRFFLIKVAFKDNVAIEPMCRILENINDTFNAYEIRNHIVVPIGGRTGIEDITIDTVEVKIHED